MHEFPRLLKSPSSKSEIHGFCDASIEAYGACVYIACKHSLENTHCAQAGTELLSRFILEVAGTSAF